MKWNGEEGSPIQKFDNEVTALIDGADASLSLAETIGVLELQIHVLKNRMTLPNYDKPTGDKL